MSSSPKAEAALRAASKAGPEKDDPFYVPPPLNASSPARDEEKNAAPANQRTAGATRQPATPPGAAAEEETNVEQLEDLQGQSAQDAMAERPAEQETPETLPPLVDDPGQLQRLHPKYPAWITKDRKNVVVVGQVCQREAPLELFACKRGSKEHESVVTLDIEAYILHAGLLATGAEPGRTVQFYPQFLPAQGPKVRITVRWKDAKGEIHQAPAQDWVRHVKTGKAMEYPWVFAGSRFVKNNETGQQRYMADLEGDLICVSNFPDAVLDLPVESTDANDSLVFEAFTEHIPPLGTPVTLVLRPEQ